MLLVTFFVLVSLVTTGGALSCIKCSDSLMPNCTGNSVTCPTDNECSTTHIEIIANGVNSTNVFRSCSPTKQCNITGRSTFPGGYLRMATSCCSTNNKCFPVTPILPQYNNTAQNGLSCRQCLSVNSEQCTSDVSMPCAGNETMCIRLASAFTGYQSSSLAFRGCATKSICNLGGQLFTTNGLTAAYNYICTSGTDGLYHGGLMPSVVFALLLKLML